MTSHDIFDEQVTLTFPSRMARAPSDTFTVRIMLRSKLTIDTVLLEIAAERSREIRNFPRIMALLQGSPIQMQCVLEVVNHVVKC